MTKPLEVSELFEDIDLGDPRRDARAQKIMQKLFEAPEQPFPQVFRAAELEAFYRFLRNPEVNASDLFDPVASAVFRQCEPGVEYLVVHDTSTFTFSGRLALRPIEKKVHGFLGHFSLLINGDKSLPLGLLNTELWQRAKDTPTKARKRGVSQTEAKKLPSEMDRWARAVDAIEEQAAAQNLSFIHVGDSELDDYVSLSTMRNRDTRFVVRSKTDRRLWEEAAHQRLRAKVQATGVLAKMNVEVSKRDKQGPSKRHPPQKARTAQLEIRATEVNICRPKNLPSSVDVPAFIKVNAILASEPHPPKGAEAIEWLLITTEPIESARDVLRVIKIYQQRWIIEEFFKALKTGCAYESRQLETFATLTNALALLAPIAVHILALRALARATPDAPAIEVLTPELLVTLKAQSGQAITTIGTAMNEIAHLGGHIESNGRPGYLVLWRGYRELILLARGFLLALQTMQNPEIHRATCDQS